MLASSLLSKREKLPNPKPKKENCWEPVCVPTYGGMQGREMELAQGGLPVDWSGQVLNLLTAVPEVVQTLISEANP